MSQYLEAYLKDAVFNKKDAVFNKKTTVRSQKTCFQLGFNLSGSNFPICKIKSWIKLFPRSFPAVKFYYILLWNFRQFRSLYLPSPGKYFNIVRIKVAEPSTNQIQTLVLNISCTCQQKPPGLTILSI